METFKRAVRGHWSIESMHWHLDVTFREGANTTLDKQTALNQNIIRKWRLSILKMIKLIKPGLPMKKKRFVITLRPIKYLEEVLSFLKQDSDKLRRMKIFKRFVGAKQRAVDKRIYQMLF